MTSTRTLVVALAANLGIAVSKFVAAAITGSSAMLTEGVHSVVDCTNQLLLMWGRRASRRPPDTLHPVEGGASEAAGRKLTRFHDSPATSVISRHWIFPQAVCS